MPDIWPMISGASTVVIAGAAACALIEGCRELCGQPNYSDQIDDVKERLAKIEGTLGRTAMQDGATSSIPEARRARDKGKGITTVEGLRKATRALEKQIESEAA